MAGRQQARKILAIDWDARTLRVVHAFIGKRGVKVDRVLAVAIPQDVDPHDPQQLGRHIRRVLDQEEIRTRRAIADIPRDQVTLNVLRLPAALPEELPGMVEIQIAKELPFAVTEAVVDFVLGEAEEGANKAPVQVAAVRREVLEQYQATFTAAGLRLERVGLRPYAIKTAVGEMLKHAMPERSMFIDVRPTLTEIDVLKDASLVFSRAASVVIPQALAEDTHLSLVRADTPSDEPDETEGAVRVTHTSILKRVVDALVLEVTRSIEAYRATNPGVAIDLAVIGGDLGVEEALAEAIQTRLNINTETYNAASSFGWEPDEGAAAAAFAATLGLVLSQTDDTGAHFDFLHPKRGTTAAKERLKKAPLVAAVVVLFVAAAGVGLEQVTGPKRAVLAEIDARIAELEAHAKDDKAFLKLVDGIREFDQRVLVWVDVLHDVLSTLPSHEELVLQDVDMKQGERKLVLKTRGKTADTATEAVAQLNEFRRPGATGARFRAYLAGQSVDKAERYPYAQMLRIEVLDDGVDLEPSPRRPG
ncbi:MAG: pilus assembly protein PilM [Phycisphaerae bacterium]